MSMRQGYVMVQLYMRGEVQGNCVVGAADSGVGVCGREYEGGQGREGCCGYVNARVDGSVEAGTVGRERRIYSVSGGGEARFLRAPWMN